MANQTAKKRKQQPTDFKRVKAKVGKRALKPANETDTSFKTASVKVGTQNVSQNREKDVTTTAAAAAAETQESTELYSTRGRSIEDLASHLRHPAAAVRTSAARGIKDAVSRPQSTPKLIRSHLPILMPVAAKCCVDEHFEVRELALVILRVIITKACRSSSEGSLFLKPFFPLLIAHVSSALNSLDRKTQLDGVKLVGMLSTSVPVFMAPYRTEILPAYVGILSHRTSQPLATPGGLEQSSTTNAGNKKKNRNKKSSADSSIQDQVLQSLLSLLKTASSGEKNSAQADTKRRTSATREPDLSVVRGGRSVNALFVPGCSPRSMPCPTIHSIEDIPNLMSAFAENPQWASVVKQSCNLDRATTCDLLSRLRDAFAEATPKDQHQHDLSEILLVIEATHLFYRSFCAANFAVRETSSTKRTDPFFKIWSQFTALIMEMFPVVSVNLPVSTVQDVNLEISTLILDAYVDGLVDDKKHFDEVLAFLFSELEKCKLSTQESKGANDQTQQASEQASLFDAVERLLVISREGREGEKFTRDIHVRVIQTIALNFFSLEDGDSSNKEVDDTALARSPAGRKCVLLLVREVFSQYDWSIRKLSSAFSTVLSQILKGLVDYLLAWESDFLYEASEVATLLHNVVRRLDIIDGKMSKEESCLVIDLRSSLGSLFKYKKKLQRKESGEFISGSRFELYPASLQKQLIGLVVMLQAPEQWTIDGLSLICARCWEAKPNAVTPGMASLVVQSIHTIRKTVSMQAYLGFLTNSMGIAKATSKKNADSRESGTSAKDIIRFDEGIQLVSGILCQCTPKKVLPMLQPLLGKWLSDVAGDLSFGYMLRARAAVTVLAECSIELREINVSLFETTPGLEKPTIQAMCSVLKHMPSCDDVSGTGNGIDSSTLDCFLEPFISLLQSQVKLLPDLYEDVSSGISTLNGRDQANLLSALLTMANDLRLASILKRCVDLVSYAKKMEEFLAGSTNERLGSRLRAILEVHLGSSGRPSAEA